MEKEDRILDLRRKETRLTLRVCLLSIFLSIYFSCIEPSVDQTFNTRRLQKDPWLPITCHLHLGHHLSSSSLPLTSLVSLSYEFVSLCLSLSLDWRPDSFITSLIFMERRTHINSWRGVKREKGKQQQHQQKPHSFSLSLHWTQE